MSNTILIWIVLSIAVGFLWKKLKLSLVSGIIWSLVLTPLLGAIIGLIIASIKKGKSDNKAVINNQP